MHETTLRLLALSSVAALAFACTETREPSGDLSPRTARNIDALTALDTANRNLRTALTGAAHAAAFADGTSVLHDLADLGSSCATDVSPPPGDGSGSGSGTGGGTSSGCGPSLDFQSGADSAADDVAERILNAANVESSSATKVVLRLDPARICGSSDSSGNGGSGAPLPDPQPSSCVQAFTNTPIRLELSSFSENDIDVAVLVGTGMANAGTITLHDDEVAVEVDLGVMRQAIVNLIEATGGSTDYLPDTMAGRLRLAVKKNATDDFTLTMSIPAALHIAKTGDHAFDVELGTASPALSIRANGVAQQLTVDAHWPAAHVELPLDAMFGGSSGPTSCTSDPNGGTNCEPTTTTPLHGTVTAIASGFSASAVVSAGDDSVHLTNVGIGSAPITVTFDGMPLASFDLNPSSGRTIDLTFASSNDGLSVKVSPRLDALVGLDLRAIADQVDSIASWTLDEDMEVKLEGAANPELVLLSSSDSNTSGPGEVPPPPSPSALMKIVAGTFSVSSRAAGKTVTVTQGMCMLDDPNAPESQTPHPMDHMVAGACP